MKRKRGAAGRPQARRRVPAWQLALRRALARRRPAGRGRAAWPRRGVLAIVLLAVVFFPVSGPVSGQQPAACGGCRVQPASAERWVGKLSGAWTAGTGTAGTVPVSGQAYVAVGGGVAAVGDGLTVSGYGLHDGRPLWRAALNAPAGAAIMSVRAWPGVVTAGVVARGGRTRTEVVIDSVTGAVLGRYPAAVFGGAVAASAATTVIVGPTSVTSYDNRDGRVRWRRQTGAGQTWRADGDVLYVAESAGGYLESAPVTTLRVINLTSGAERSLHSPPGRSFSGRLAVAADGVVLFTSASGVTAYSGLTGGTLWTMPAAVPEGADPSAHLVYLTSAAGALVGADPLTGAVKASVPGSTAGGSAGMYVVRGGVALGLDGGQSGEAWGFNVAAGRVTWTAAALPWPHYFSDLSGLGGSAALSGDTVVIAACPKLAPTPATPTSTPAPTLTPTPASPAGTGTAAVTGTPSATGTPGATGTPTGTGTPGATTGSSATAAIRSPSATPSTRVSSSPTVTASPSASPTASPAPPVQLCADPELVALNV
jgi:hypothetical protein